MSSKKTITGFVPTNYVSIIPKAISCSWTTIKKSVSINHHPIWKQSSLKYVGVILDDKLNWKPQIEMLVTQLSKSCGMLFKLKHYTKTSVLKSVYFALFHSYLTSSILNWGRTNKTTLLLSYTRLRILLDTICRKPGFNSLRTPLNHGAEQASNETLKQAQQRNWSNASQGGQTALKEHVAVLHSETASTTQQPRAEHRGTIKDCKIAGATTRQRQSNHTFTTTPFN